MSKQLQTSKMLGELIKLDLRQLRLWFSKNTASKIFVISIYLLILIGVGSVIFLWSNIFFKYLIGFQQFGADTADYILKGAFVIFFWIGILSSLIGTSTYLLTSNRFTDLLITMPIADSVFTLYQTLKSLITNSLLFLISIFPLVLGFIYSQNSPNSLMGLVALFIALITLVVLTQSIGSTLAYLLTFISKKKYGLVYIFISVLSIVAITWLLIRLIFPPELKLLDSIPAESFRAFFNLLPLNANCWLCTNFITMSTNMTLSSIPLIVMAALFFGLSLIIQKKLFIPCWQSVRILPGKPMKASTTPKSLSGISLETKDILSITRSVKNWGYAIFLLLMVVTFFGLISRGYVVGRIPERFRINAIAFSFAWLIFFSGTYLLRFVYPLMVNEGRSRWWFFTGPTSAPKKVLPKLATSLLLSLPLYLVALVQWYLVPFTTTPLFMGVLSVLAITFLAVAMPLMGIISPDYSLAFEPDKASTSFTGIVSLILIVTLGVLGGYLIQLSLADGLSQSVAINVFFAISIAISLILYWVSIKSTEKYRLDF